jgi:hypothetical protein
MTQGLGAGDRALVLEAGLAVAVKDLAIKPPLVVVLAGAAARGRG